MATPGWKQLIPRAPLYQGPGRYPIDAYSEFLPPPRLWWKPYRCAVTGDPPLFTADDPRGWHVSEYEEANELVPGLDQVAHHLIPKLRHQLQGHTRRDLPRTLLDDNPYWPPELAERAGRLDHDHAVTLLPLALSRTQDDKGRLRWTLLGCSEQGPGRAFWKSFAETPAAEEEGPRFLARLIHAVYRRRVETVTDLVECGFRILPQGEPPLALWEEALPPWTQPFLLDDKADVTGVKYLLTFRPFAQLSGAIRKAYLKGSLHLLPSPASLVFWGVPRILKLHGALPLALQAPLLQAVARFRGPGGLRTPQAGLLHEPNAAMPQPAHPELVRNTFKRTHRWDRILRDQDELELLEREDKLLHVLFSSNPDDVGLYDKPMARGVQIWTGHGDLVLDGPTATPAQIKTAMRTVEAGGLFGYRFVHPAMRVGRHEVYWHRPLVAYHAAATDAPAVLTDAPLGYLTAYPTELPPRPPRGQPADELTFRTGFRVTAEALATPVELWPRLLRRPLPLASLPLYHTKGKGPTTARNVRKLYDAYHLRGNAPLPPSLARALLTLAHDETLDGWLAALPDPHLAEGVRDLIAPPPTSAPAAPLTFDRTARRSFEVAYWKTIATLAEGRFLNKNNADCVRDPITQRQLPYHGRHLDALGDYLLAYYRKQIARAGLQGRARTGALPFRWATDFPYEWMGGWLQNRERPAERNLLTVIPGQDRGRAVIMADHYDTAYMADRFEGGQGGKGARLAACGADDNHSATAALMLAAPIFLDLSRAGRLGCDVWLIHLTGEEFPADCLGARHLTQALVEGTLALVPERGNPVDLSGVRVQGVYVADMIAHNNDHQRDVFQMAPGTGPASFWLAEQAQAAAAAWNAGVPAWNRRPSRRGKHRARRSPHGAAVPETFAHLALSGEVRPVTDPRSTLYNTDGQIFSDAGVPVVLFMENYDIDRQGYHDTHDTMANIDLDYGAALAAIFIEAVARAAAGET